MKPTHCIVNILSFRQLWTASVATEWMRKCLFTVCFIMTGFFGWAKKQKTLEVWVGASSCRPANTGTVGDLEERAEFVSPVPLSGTPSSPSVLWFTPCCWWRVYCTLLQIHFWWFQQGFTAPRARKAKLL